MTTIDPHEEMARELAAWLHGYLYFGNRSLSDEKALQQIAAALASVERTPWQRCPVTGDEHTYSPYSGGCLRCGVFRSVWERLAVEPAPAPQGEK